MMRTAAILILGATIMAGPACGKKGPLERPLVREPQPVSRLSAFQRGGRVVLEWTNPAKYADGRPLPAVGAVEIWGFESDPEATEAPPKPADFARAARRLQRVERSRFAAELRGTPDPGGSLAWTRDAPAPGRMVTLSVRTFDSRGHGSEFAPPASVKVRAWPLPPGIAGLRVEKDRIEIRWTPPDAGPGGAGNAAAAGYAVYRSEDHGPFVKLASLAGTARSLDDRGFTFGRTYAYVVRSLAAGPEPALESEDSTPAEITALDTFPPDAPSDVVAFAGTESVSLSWEAVKDADLAGYLVWRREAGGGEFACLTPGALEQTSFTDATARAGTAYVYAVSARDKAGNESVRSESGPVTPKGKTP